MKYGHYNGRYVPYPFVIPVFLVVKMKNVDSLFFSRDIFVIRFNRGDDCCYSAKLELNILVTHSRQRIGICFFFFWVVLLKLHFCSSKIKTSVG